MYAAPTFDATRSNPAASASKASLCDLSVTQAVMQLDAGLSLLAQASNLRFRLAGIDYANETATIS
jgi:hypothetical protein